MVKNAVDYNPTSNYFLNGKPGSTYFAVFWLLNVFYFWFSFQPSETGGDKSDC